MAGSRKRKKTTKRARTAPSAKSKAASKVKRGAKKSAKVAAKARTKSRAKAIAPARGPVTLAEAKALAQAKQPTLAAAPVRKDVAPPTSLVAVGATRKDLQKKRENELARRVREYRATMAIMKKRGARRPRPKSAAKSIEEEAAGRAESFAPLQIFAEGDSWFDYPIPFFGGGIIPRLENRLGVPILNLAKAGDEVRYMLGVEERKLLTKYLTDGCPAGGAWDALVFSGGGNDIADNPMALWVRDWDPNNTPAGHIHQQRFDAALALVRAGYEDLIALRNKLSPDTHLIFHGYDFAIPDGRGVCFLGPWLKPTFDLRQFPTQRAGQEVVKAMLQQFAVMMADLATRPKVTFLPSQGTLPPQTSSWHNELHPSRDGFEKFADIFYLKLKELYPERVV